MFNIGDVVDVNAPHFKGRSTIERYWSTNGKERKSPDRVPYPYYLANGHLVSGNELTLVTRRAPIARALSLHPQTKTILRHMEKRGSISPMEALLTYGCSRLAARIHEIRRAGIEVTTSLRQDEAGHRYARYSLAA